MNKKSSNKINYSALRTCYSDYDAAYDGWKWITVYNLRRRYVNGGEQAVFIKKLLLGTLDDLT